MFDLTAYSEEIRAILAAHESGERLMPLAPTGPLRGEGLERLRQVSSRDLFGDEPVAAEDFAECVRGALFLYLSDLDESHTISQNIATASGSYLHGIMHRQEPDFSNSKYWFRRVGYHETFPGLREAALGELAEKAEKSRAARRLQESVERRPQWDPFWFVDQCELAGGERDSDLEQRLMEMQRLEWQLLFDYCYRKAVGKD